MTKPKEPDQEDIVYNILSAMLGNSPEASYKRLNPALRDTLANCIAADLPFQPDTFRRVFDELRGGWWFGDGAGSHKGEGLYSLACRVNHTSAQQSFEQWAERPGVLWEEDSKHPERLHVGSQITWKGVCLEVTSMRQDSLVACSYLDIRRDHDSLEAGAYVGYSPERLILESKREGKAFVLKVVDAAPTKGESRTVAKRVTIDYQEIQELRKTCRARVRAMVEKIAACDPETERAKLTKEINEEHFRHFELEQIRDAFTKRTKWLENEKVVESWRKGQGGAWIGSHGIILRVRADRVECSTGTGISRSAARAVLPVLMANRHKAVELGIRLDSYTVRRVNPKGVTVGCTLVPWEEVERIVPELQAQA